MIKQHWLVQHKGALILLPSLILTTIFIYGFIGSSFFFSLTNWRTLAIDLSLRDPLWQTYADMFSMPRFQADLRNTFVFTLLFIGLATGIGLGLAILLDRQISQKGWFRNTFLFPYALSFIVTGVVWRWIFNPETGINLFFNFLGINRALEAAGMDPLSPGWTTDPTIVFSVNQLLYHLWPDGRVLQIEWGIPVALIPIAIAATWQLSGFVMAMYLGGLGGISSQIRDAAQIDGAGEIRLYSSVIIPMLNPITISTIIILLHVSLKIFDLVFAMSGVGPGFATDVPAIFVFEMMFKAARYNLGSAASIVMLVASSVVIVPYLIHTFKTRES
ncbi:MAG: sugar ABC transporter permease [Bacteroidetes bacterium]|nr:sugar ABC transporter permease [Bacteroidota bacterium]